VNRGLAYACLGLYVLTADAWFGGPLMGGQHRPMVAAVLATLGIVAAAVALRTSAARAPRSFLLLIAGILILASLVRLPALLRPSSVISGDSAVNGIVAHELRLGNIAPPVYPPGYPYEGTLKVNLTALAGRLLPSVGTPSLYIWIGHAFYLVWIAAVMALARRVRGDVAAAGAGLFMALAPRFLTAFSVNNVGQYQELNALGALGLVLLAGGSVLAAAFAVGLAVWQQLVASYFVLALAIAVVITPSLRGPRALLDGLIGFTAGTYPIWIWNFTNGWGTFDFFRRGAKGGPADRLAEWPTQMSRTLSVSFPKMFGATDLGLGGTLATVLALALPLVVIALAWSRRSEMRAERGRSAAFLAVLLFTIGLSVFTVSKFSRRGIQRPRYLLPLYTPVAVAAGWAFASLAARSRPAAGAGAVAVLGWNLAGTLPWLIGRAPAAAYDAAFLRSLEDAGVHRAHAGFTLATRYTFLSGGRVLIAGDLGPEVDWVYLPHAQRIEAEGADAYIGDRADLADGLSRRFTALGVSFKKTEGLPAIFHGFSRPVSLSELDGYDAGAEASPTSEGE
jgi:hypothetical protein